MQPTERAFLLPPQAAHSRVCGPRIASSQHILHPILIVNQIHIQFSDAAVSDL